MTSAEKRAGGEYMHAHLGARLTYFEPDPRSPYERFLRKMLGWVRNRIRARREKRLREFEALKRVELLKLRLRRLDSRISHTTGPG